MEAFTVSAWQNPPPTAPCTLNLSQVETRSIPGLDPAGIVTFTMGESRFPPVLP